MIWSQQTTIEAFVGEVLDHIEGTLFLNPKTGLLTLKLIRADYDINDVPELNVDNCEIASFQRKSPADTINEVVVTWTNPVNEKEETVTYQDLAGISVQGGIVSDSRNYYGVRRQNLAMKLAARDIRTASAPLASCEAKVNRTGWDLVPGGVVRLEYPEYGSPAWQCGLARSTTAALASPRSRSPWWRTSSPSRCPEYDEPPATEWVDPSEDPRPADFSRVFTLPYFLTGMYVDPGILSGHGIP
jgi:hypothetical protein